MGQQCSQLTAHWIIRNWSDFEMLLTAPALTLPGYTVGQTRAEMLRQNPARARADVGQAEPRHKLGPEPTGPQNAAAVATRKDHLALVPLSYLPGRYRSWQATAAAARASSPWILLLGSPPAPVADQRAIVAAGRRTVVRSRGPPRPGLVPRLMAAKARRERVHFVSPRELAALNLRAFVQEQSSVSSS